MSEIGTVHGPEKCTRVCSECEGDHHWIDEGVAPEDLDEWIEDNKTLAPIPDAEELKKHCVAFYACKHCNAWAEIGSVDEQSVAAAKKAKPVGASEHGGGCICIHCRLDRATHGWFLRDQHLALVIEILGECVAHGLHGEALRQQYERCKAIKETSRDPGPYLDPTPPNPATRKCERSTMKIGIVADDWKEQIFRDHLDRAGYEYEFFNGPWEGVVTFKVTTDHPESLQGVIRHCQTEAKRSKKRK